MFELLICPIANPWVPAKDGYGVNGVLIALVPIHVHVLLLPGMETGIGLFSKLEIFFRIASNSRSSDNKSTSVVTELLLVHVEVLVEYVATCSLRIVEISLFLMSLNLLQ